MIVLQIDDDSQVEELYKLLNQHYVEDDDNMFRFNYSPQFLKWALTPPGWQKELLCAIRDTTNEMVGFISAVPATIRVEDTVKKITEINFLCLHRNLRTVTYTSN